MEYPRLIENNVKYYLFDHLQKCHQHKTTLYSWVFNISIFLVFFTVLFLVLYFSRKNKLTPYELEEKQLKEQQYVLSKIREYKMEKTKKPQTISAITNLPFTYNPDVVM
jgi:hypothetical protein